MLPLCRKLLSVVALGGAFFLGGCASPTASTPIRPELAAQGLSVVRALPAVLPEKSVVVPQTQWVLVPNDSAAGLLMPVPFVAEAISAAVDRSAADGLAPRLAALAPDRLALAAMKDSPLFRAQGGGLRLEPFVFITEGADARYRIASVFQLEGGGWLGRYTVHLPTTYPLDAFKQPSEATLGTLQRELAEAATQLRGLVERGAAGGLNSTGAKAEVGSLHLVGGKAAGLVSPTLLRVQDADLIEETDDHIIVRLPGKMGDAGTLGGLFFGVHLLRKDQLHTFKKA